MGSFDRWGVLIDGEWPLIGSCIVLAVALQVLLVLAVALQVIGPPPPHRRFAGHSRYGREVAAVERRSSQRSSSTGEAVVVAGVIVAEGGCRRRGHRR